MRCMYSIFLRKNREGCPNISKKPFQDFFMHLPLLGPFTYYNIVPLLGACKSQLGGLIFLAVVFLKLMVYMKYLFSSVIHPLVLALVVVVVVRLLWLWLWLLLLLSSACPIFSNIQIRNAVRSKCLTQVGTRCHDSLGEHLFQGSTLTP